MKPSTRTPRHCNLVGLSEGQKAQDCKKVQARINIYGSFDKRPAGQRKNPLKSSIKANVEATWRTSTDVGQPASWPRSLKGASQFSLWLDWNTAVNLFRSFWGFPNMRANAQSWWNVSGTPTSSSSAYLMVDSIWMACIRYVVWTFDPSESIWIPLQKQWISNLYTPLIFLAIRTLPSYRFLIFGNFRHRLVR